MVLGVSPALVAQTAPSAAFATGWGPHLGLTVNPDQFHFGLHLQSGAIGTGISWRPNFDLGIGDGVTVAAVNLEVIRRFPVSPNDWAPFVGGGIGANFNEHDTPRYAGNADGLGSNFETGVGFNLIAGFERNLGGESIFAEARLGLIDAPGLKITVGWTMFR